MADQTAEHILRTVDPERTVIGGGAPKWDAHGRTGRVIAQGIDMKKFNDAVPAAQRVGAGDDVEILELGPWTMLLAYALTNEATAGATCTGDLVLGSTNVINNHDFNTTDLTTRGAGGATTPFTTGDPEKLTVHFDHAPGNTKFTLFALTADMREEFN